MPRQTPAVIATLALLCGCGGVNFDRFGPQRDYGPHTVVVMRPDCSAPILTRLMLTVGGQMKTPDREVAIVRLKVPQTRDAEVSSLTPGRCRFGDCEPMIGYLQDRVLEISAGRETFLRLPAVELILLGDPIPPRSGPLTDECPVDDPDRRRQLIQQADVMTAQAATPSAVAAAQ